ncbi:MAG: hypothetical protein AB7K52_02105 [Phycisphaerales bacterium]
MRHALNGALAALAIVSPSLAQWTGDAGGNSAIADRSGAQVQPKIRAAPDGGCWVSWFDNFAGGFDVQLQRLDAGGAEVFAHNGLLIADRGFSSTQDYDLRVNAEGDAIIAFRSDTASPGTVQIVVQRVTSAGALPWGNAGVIASAGALDKNTPRCAVLEDGSVAVAWTGGSPASVSLQMILPDGTLVLPAPSVYSDTGSPQRPLQVADLQAAGADAFIALMIRCSGSNCVTSSKHLHAQKFDAATLTPQWDRDTSNATPGEAIIVFDGTSIQNGTFPPFFPDGSGGGVFAWYETGGARAAYVQRLDSSGAEVFPHNGVAALITPGLLQISAGASLDFETGDMYVAIKTTNAGQNQWGIRAARITAGGARAWGDEGVELVPFNGVQSSFESAVAETGGGGCDFFWFENSGGLAGRLLGAGLGADQSPRFPGIIEVSSVSSVKGRISVDRASLGNALVAWHDARSDANDILAQSVRPDGSLGAPDVACRIDFNGDGEVNADDLGDFINCYFASPPCADADYNGADGVNADDLGDFINDYFTASC